jgi:plastocyanin
LHRRGKKLAGAIAVAIASMAHHAAAADLPVHQIEIVPGKFAFEPATIQVTAGEPVRLVIRSKDTVHGFSIPKLKIISYFGAGPLSLDPFAEGDTQLADASRLPVETRAAAATHE